MRSATIGALLAALCLLMTMSPSHAIAQQVSMSFQLFYDELSPHGTWVEYPEHGYVWIPDHDPGFRPYESAGHWVFTEDGWTWVSDYPWGWAPFHYGRWGYDDFFGWYWVPDNVWGPAWVTWRRSPGYYGWAPLRPGISINIAFGSTYREPNERWIFVNEVDITRSDLSRHYVDRRSNRSIIRRSSVIKNTRTDRERNATFVSGPERDEVRKATRAEIPSVSIRNHGRPGQRLDGAELHLYRPRVEPGNDQGRRPAPSVVKNVDEVRTSRSPRAPQQRSAVEPMKGRPKNDRSATPRVAPSVSGGKQQPPARVTPATRDDTPRKTPAATTKDVKKKRKDRP